MANYPRCEDSTGRHCWERVGIEGHVHSQHIGCCTDQKAREGFEGTTPGLVIRFDGPPAHESGRFVEVELDGRGVSIGEWVDAKDGSGHCLLVMPPQVEAAFRAMNPKTS